MAGRKKKTELEKLRIERRNGSAGKDILDCQ